MQRLIALRERLSSMNGKSGIISKLYFCAEKDNEKTMESTEQENFRIFTLFDQN